jgi:hypothetical protein
MLADWRDHPGVEMWVAANYTIALRAREREGARGDRLEEMLATSHEALDQLANDWTVRYLACVNAESALRLRRYEDFLETMHIHWHYINPDADHQALYMRATYQGIPEVLHRFYQLLGGESSVDARTLDRHVIATIVHHQLPPWVLEAWCRCRRRFGDRPPSFGKRCWWRAKTCRLT